MSGVQTLWGLFLSLLVLFIFSLLLIVSKWVEAKATKNNDVKVVVDFADAMAMDAQTLEWRESGVVQYYVFGAIAAL